LFRCDPQAACPQPRGLTRLGVDDRVARPARRGIARGPAWRAAKGAPALRGGGRRGRGEAAREGGGAGPPSEGGRGGRRRRGGGAGLGLPRSALAQAGFDWKRFKGEHIEVLMAKGPRGDLLQKYRKEFEELTGMTVGDEQVPEQQQRQKTAIEFSSGSTSFDV